MLAAILLPLAAPSFVRGEEAAAPPSPPAPPADQAGAGSGHQRTGKISGTVTDATRRVLAGLLVKLESRVDPGMLRVTCTDLKGQYHFKDLPPGVYDVRVEAEGFGPGSKEMIDVRPPFQNIVDVAMVRAAAGSPATPAPGVPAPAPAGSADAGAAIAGETNEAPVVVRGRFVNPGGQPELEVSVLLVRADGGRLYQTFSADDGTFVIPDVVPGRYRVLVRSAGHVTIDLKSVDVRPVNGLKLSLALVDFPLNTRPRGSRPQEMPRPLPTVVLAPPGETPAPPPEESAPGS